MGEGEVTKVNLPKFPQPQLIVLSIEEAKQIVDSLHRSIKAHIEVSRLTNGWTEVSIEENIISMLKERIEQTGMKDEAQ